MTPSVSRFWVRWIQVVVFFGLILFGLALLLVAAPSQALLNRLYFGQAAYPAGFTPPSIEYVTFIMAILGAVTVGWGVSLYCLAALLADGHRMAWNGLAFGALTWGLLDSTASVLLGFGSNLALNIPILVLLAIPLAATFRSVYGRQ